MHVRNVLPILLNETNRFRFDVATLLQFWQTRRLSYLRCQLSSKFLYQVKKKFNLVSTLKQARKHNLGMYST